MKEEISEKMLVTLAVRAAHRRPEKYVLEAMQNGGFVPHQWVIAAMYDAVLYYTESTPKVVSANERQVGGDHYKVGGEEHWDRIHRLYGPGYFIGCITKYVERYQKKNGIQDLEKAQHYLQKLIELERVKESAAEPGRNYVHQE